MSSFVNFSCSTELYSRLKKKMHNVRVVSEVLFGANENCSPGDSTSDSSEKLLQGGRGEVTLYVILVKGEYM